VSQVTERQSQAIYSGMVCYTNGGNNEPVDFRLSIYSQSARWFMDAFSHVHVIPNTVNGEVSLG